MKYSCVSRVFFCLSSLLASYYIFYIYKKFISTKLFNFSRNFLPPLFWILKRIVKKRKILQSCCQALLRFFFAHFFLSVSLCWKHNLCLTHKTDYATAAVHTVLTTTYFQKTQSFTYLVKLSKYTRRVQLKIHKNNTILDSMHGLPM